MFQKISANERNFLYINISLSLEIKLISVISKEKHCFSLLSESEDDIVRNLTFFYF